MTNHWADIGNATLVVAMGANPSENHPACMAHVNAARYPSGAYANKPKAKLVVIDPRKTRTALQADLYVRIRPGTDIAFINGLVNQVITWMEANPADPKSVKFFAHLNHTVAAGKSFYNIVGGSASTTRTDWTKYTDARLLVTADDTDYQRENWPSDIDPNRIANLPKMAASCTDADTVYDRLKAHVAHYTPAVVADICGCAESDVAAVATEYINNSRCADTAALGAEQDPTAAGWRSTTMLYAMGLTQHTYGSQNVKSFTVLQGLLGNMGRLGGGINALRGIHNVQGSTDMGLLRHLIPAYSGNPVTRRAVDGDAFGKYMDNLWGNRLSGGTAAYDDAYTRASQGLQQSGFFNMTRAFFGDYTLGNGTAAENRAQMDVLWDLWPKTNGDMHIDMFRKMAAGTITAAYVLGQNPAVTEPHQTAVRDGLYNLDLLVVQDMFENETAGCDRKAAGHTYLLPACSHVEKAGSVTNSGRTLQWRYAAIDPKGNSRPDMEYILRFAKALDTAGAFSHIRTAWDGLTFRSGVSAYTVLYDDQYGWDPADGRFTGATAEAVSAACYQQMCTDVLTTGTMWIYTKAYDTAGTNVLPTLGGTEGTKNWTQAIRAKNRDNFDYGNKKTFSRWGYAWLVNRRVLYNNGEIGTFDNSDTFQRPEGCASLFVTTGLPGLTTVDYAKANYRTYHKLADTPTAAQSHRRKGFPFHVEPYESPRDGAGNPHPTYAGKSNLVTAYGRNGTNGTENCIVGPVYGATFTATPRGTSDDYPLVLTSIRCVEHFQGGPITRNNAWNHEVEPEPWIEINALDAARYGIRNGQKVKITTARGASDQATTRMPAPPTSPGGFGGVNFTARVGVGLQANQRVAPGVVAIPWHWGDKGLSTGARANDLCIDAFDANSQIPEYKACLCKIDPA